MILPNNVDSSLLSLSSDQMQSLRPYFWVCWAAIQALFIGMIRSVRVKWILFAFSMMALLMGAASAWQFLDVSPATLFSDMIHPDSFANFFNLLFIFAAIVTLVFSLRYLDREKLQFPEYTALVLFSTIGMMLLAAATELIVLFIALEIMSLAVYVLVGFRRADRRSNEASMKYFILGSAASAILLYGAALIYGAVGSTVIPEIATW